jgi:hypothetical protein
MPDLFLIVTIISLLAWVKTQVRSENGYESDR